MAPGAGSGSGGSGSLDTGAAAGGSVAAAAAVLVAVALGFLVRRRLLRRRQDQEEAAAKEWSSGANPAHPSAAPRSAAAPRPDRRPGDSVTSMPILRPPADGAQDKKQQGGGGLDFGAVVASAFGGWQLGAATGAAEVGLEAATAVGAALTVAGAACDAIDRITAIAQQAQLNGTQARRLAARVGGLRPVMGALAGRLRAAGGGAEAEAQAESLKDKLDRTLEVVEEAEALLGRWAKGGDEGLAQVLRWLQSGDHASNFKGVNSALSDVLDDLRTDLAVRQLAPEAGALRAGAADSWAAQDAGDRSMDLRQLPAGLVAAAGGVEELRQLAEADPRARSLEGLQRLLRAGGVPAAELSAALRRDMASVKRAVSATGSKVDALEVNLEMLIAELRAGGGTRPPSRAGGGSGGRPLPRYIMRASQVRITNQLIGRGGYGNVYRAVMDGTSEVAAKVAAAKPLPPLLPTHPPTHPPTPSAQAFSPPGAVTGGAAQVRAPGAECRGGSDERAAPP